MWISSYLTTIELDKTALTCADAGWAGRHQARLDRRVFLGCI
jgi:hypothetical protein